MKTMDLKNMRRCKGLHIFLESGATLKSRCQKSVGKQNLVAWVSTWELCIAGKVWSTAIWLRIRVLCQNYVNSY